VFIPSLKSTLDTDIGFDLPERQQVRFLWGAFVIEGHFSVPPHFRWKANRDYGRPSGLKIPFLGLKAPPRKAQAFNLRGL
jgi:hypothetical protein